MGTAVTRWGVTTGARARDTNVGRLHTTMAFFTRLTAEAQRAPDLVDWISPSRSPVRTNWGRSARRFRQLRSSLPHVHAFRSPLGRSPIEKGLRWATLLLLGVLGFSPTPVWLAEFRISTRWHAAWFFSRKWLYALEGDSNSHWETRKPDWCLANRTSRCCHPAREGRPPVFGHGCTSPLFFSTRGRRLAFRASSRASFWWV